MPTQLASLLFCLTHQALLPSPPAFGFVGGLLESWFVFAIWVFLDCISRFLFFFFFQLVASFLVELKATMMVVVVWLCHGFYFCGDRKSTRLNSSHSDSSRMPSSA